MKTKIANATVVLPGEVLPVDVIISGTQIAEIDPAPQIAVEATIDASGLHLLPGIIDDQVHFREPGFVHKEDLSTGSAACAAGGITTYLEMPNTRPTTTTCQRLAEKLALAATKSLVNYGFYIGATPDNLAELAHAEQTPGIKIFMGSSTGDLLVDDQDALERIFAETTLPICAHCEDEAVIRANREALGPDLDVADHSRIRDVRAAVVATQRAVDLAKRHRHRFHVLHVSTADELTIIRDHGRLITAEACPHHLFFNVDDYARLGSLVQMNPSLKSVRDNRALWEALLDGTIQVVATDHAPHTLEEKSQPYPASPSGLPAVENSLPLMLHQVAAGRCTLQQIANWMSAAPARVWDIVDKGEVRVGYDADLVLVDLELEQTVINEQQHSKTKWSPWHGERLTGWPVQTWVRGAEVFRHGQLNTAVRGAAAKFDHARGGYW